MRTSTSRPDAGAGNSQRGTPASARGAFHATLVSTESSRLLARATATRAAGHGATTVTILDVDGSYRTAGAERVVAPPDLGIDRRSLHVRAAQADDALAPWLEAHLARAVLAEVGTDPAPVLLAIRPGVLLLRRPVTLVDTAREGRLVLVSRHSRTPVTALADAEGTWPSLADAETGSYHSSILALREPHADILELWAGSANGQELTSGWLDVAASRVEHAVIRDPAVVVSPWTLLPSDSLWTEPAEGGSDLLLDGKPVEVLDLSGWAPGRPWLLDARSPRVPRARLSDHPALAGLVADLAAELAADDDPVRTSPGRRAAWDPATTSLGYPVDRPIRHLYRDATPEVPDPYDPADAEDLRTWLTAPGPDGVPRYLGAVHATRPDLQRAFPRVPGADTPRLHAWAQRHAATEGYPPALVAGPVAGSPADQRPGRARPGVTVAGFLAGGMGLAESARQLVAALDAVGVAHAEHTVQGYVTSRTAVADRGRRDALDTTVLCVNADLAPAVAAELPRDIARAYRIGLWYWEVEEFPPTQHGGFEAVDEVWVATRFVHDAIAPHSPVPVRTLMPPLPQRGPEPTVTAAQLGLGDRPYLLFTFDFLSTAERKNPWGLVGAYRSAFAPGEGPRLVIKSINADQRPADAERLRLAAAAHPDVVLLERFLPAAERDALVAHCLAYVSLHRSEGLGLTMAEAMAWGKPVVATGYSGNLDFMTDENSFLVPWLPVAIPEDAPPYPAGTRWADPDLTAAAELLRRLVTHPEEAAARGARAAHDIATLHSPAVAGPAFAARLAELGPARRAAARRDLVRRLRRTAAAVRDAWR